jgi:ABC-type glycerol-3-phosphate transport system substrate-binding protein
MPAIIITGLFLEKTDMSKFQIIVLGLFAFLAVGGLIFFSVYKGNTSAGPGTMIIWGTLDRATINTYAEALLKQAGEKTAVKYFQIPKNQLYQAYLESFSNGNGPDLLLISQDQYIQFSNKLYLIPYQELSQAAFKSAYISGDNIFLQGQGMSAIPFTVDPLVMYWNKDLFKNALIPNPPALWSDITPMAGKLTQKDAALSITTSAVGLGEYRNIPHAKEILSLLMMQTGNDITQYGIQGLSSSISSGGDSTAALAYYTQFANPLKQTYSWNRALPDAKTLFIQNHLGMYFGYVSEFGDITQKNPNLNFDVSLIPQSQATNGGQPIRATYANFYGLALARTSRDTTSAIKIAKLFGSQNGSLLWSQMTGLPSDRRDSLNFSSSNAVTATFATSAFWSIAWFDPNPYQTDIIFGTMIENITSGRSSYGEAVQQADKEMENILHPI